MTKREELAAIEAKHGQVAADVFRTVHAAALAKEARDNPTEDIDAVQPVVRALAVDDIAADERIEQLRREGNHMGADIYAALKAASRRSEQA